MNYSCPMHPEVVKEKPGLCSLCGMKLLPQKKYRVHHEDHSKHEGHSLSIFLRKFWTSLLLTIPVVLYSDILTVLFRYAPPSFPGSHLIPLTFATIIFFYGGWIFIKGTASELRARQPGMMTLIAMAISVAYFYSVFSIFFGGSNLFWELSTLITIMLLGHYIEMRAVQGAQGALKELSKLLPDQAEVKRNGKKVTLPLQEVEVNDIVFIRPGGRIPVDGIIKEGSSEINEAMVTGESKPVGKKKGEEVIAGTINGTGSLQIRVTKIGNETFLSGIMRLVEEAQSSKSRLQVLSDRAAFYLTLIALASGGVTLISWIFIDGNIALALERTVAVLVIACPHALGLAVPLVAAISTSMAAKNGFLVKQRLALEQARNIDIVLFDKTGTLTQGEYGVSKIWKIKAKDANEIMQIAASVESHSEHFTAKAIVKESQRRKIKLIRIKNFTSITGKGVKATVGKDEIKIGGLGILESKKNLSKVIEKEVQKENGDGKSIIYVLRNKEIIGIISLADIIRSESRQAIKDLRDLDIKAAMITGDTEEVAEWVSKELGLNEYFANVRPEDKSNKVKELQSKGQKVAMVGDGINDAPALTQADLGIAIGAGTNVAIESAGIILMRSDPRDIVKIVKLSKITYAKMLQNLFWATGYNVIAIPLAAGALAFKGIFLQPAVAAILMSVSTIVVAINAVSMRSKRLSS